MTRSSTTYTGRAFTVRRDEVRLPGGQETTFDIVVHAGAVAIVALDASGDLWMVRQYRHSTGQILLEIPAGTLEPGEDPEACARRECQEEIGMAPGRIEPLGQAFLAPGYSTEFMYFFLATDLSPSRLEGDLDEDITIERVSPARLRSLVASGELQDVKTMAAVFLAQARIPGLAPVPAT